MEKWTKRLLFRCSDIDATWYDKLRLKLGLATMSDLLRQALRALAEKESVQRPITNALSSKEAKEFPLTTWKLKAAKKKSVKPKKKVVK